MPKKIKKNADANQNTRLVWLEIVLAILIFVAGVVFVNETSKQKIPEEKLSKNIAEKNLEAKEEITFERIEIPTTPTSLPRLGKDGALLTAYFFADYRSESEQKFYQEILPKLHQYTDDGTLKIYWVIRDAQDELSYQTAMATKCTQRYGDEFFWKYADELYTRKLPLKYADLLSVTRKITLNEYYFARCVTRDFYDADINAEAEFAQKLNITTPTFILDGIVFTEFDAQEIMDTITEITKPKNFTNLENYLVEENETSATLLHEPSWGNPSAKIQIIEFCDFTSKACRDIQPAIAHLQKQYADKIYLKFYNLPLNEKAEQLAESSECAHEQGGFWNYYNWLFVNQENLDLENLGNAVLGLGLQPRALELCLSEKRYAAEVADDMAIAERLKIKTVPTLCIDTDCIKGTLTPDDIDRILELKLAN